MQELNDFVNHYNSLQERDKFKLGVEFNKQTGGKLSPYNSPDVVCVGLVRVINESGVVGFVGVRRAIAPCVGEVALPGGFLNPEEDPAVGAQREILEETGLNIDDSGLSPIMIKMGHNNHTLVFFSTEQVINYEDFKKANENLKGCDGEASELVFIDETTKLCFPLHQQAVNKEFEKLGIESKIKITSLKF